MLSKGDAINFKELSCDCGFSVKGRDEKEVVDMAAMHLIEVHDMSQVPSRMKKPVRTARA